MDWWPEILSPFDFVPSKCVRSNSNTIEKWCCFFQNLHTSPKPALNSNLKHESRITLNLLRGWGYLVDCFLFCFYHQIWIWPTASKDKNAAAQSLWVVVFSFTIALVSWFTLPAFRDSYGKPPPFPWISQDLSVFNCLGLWKYMKQFPYRNRLKETSFTAIDHLPRILNRLVHMSVLLSYFMYLR